MQDGGQLFRELVHPPSFIYSARRLIRDGCRCQVDPCILAVCNPATSYNVAVIRCQIWMDHKHSSEDYFAHCLGICGYCTSTPIPSADQIFKRLSQVPSSRSCLINGKSVKCLKFTFVKGRHQHEVPAACHVTSCGN